LGVFGCLGNHELWMKVGDSITGLFESVGIHILRRGRASIAASGESFNLIGVDNPITLRREGTRTMLRFLEGVQDLMAPGTANVLLCHYPDGFDPAAKLGLDLTLSGHTHGGQVAIGYADRNWAFNGLVTPYVAGWYEKPGSRLYVNRGIGTIGLPIRLRATPEIALFSLSATSA
jgi:hypothetical protein